MAKDAVSPDSFAASLNGGGGQVTAKAQCPLETAFHTYLFATIAHSNDVSMFLVEPSGRLTPIPERMT